jgi:hypothetical protein
VQRQIALRDVRLLLAIAALTLACQTQPGTLTPPRELKIVQAEGGCPVDVKPPVEAECRERPGKTCVHKNDKLVWVADRAFAIHFDPIQGHPIKSPPGCPGPCKTAPVPIDPDAPPTETDTVDEVEYKYTVVVEGCGTPLDPPIFIQK